MNQLLFFVIILFILLFIMTKTKKTKNIYHIEIDFRKEYKKVKLMNFFKNNIMPTNETKLKFGFVCPGAIKTLDYLRKNSRQKVIVNKIRKLTDLLFFIEIIVIYNKYLEKEFYYSLKKKLSLKECYISNKITSEITNLFNQLTNDIQINIPDNFYHIRHNTIICSKDKNIAKQRVKLIKGLITENFQDIDICKNKKDGVSGCRDCCSRFTKKKYNRCINKCMDFD